MLYYRVDNNGDIIDSATFKYSKDCLETDKNIAVGFNGKLVFEEELNTQEYIKEKANFEEEINNLSRIAELKQQIARYKEDVEQVELFGMQRDDYAEKKAQCVAIIEELRVLEKQIKESN